VAKIEVRQLPGREHVHGVGGSGEGVGEPGDDEIGAGDRGGHQNGDGEDVEILVSCLEGMRQPELQ